MVCCDAGEFRREVLDLEREVRDGRAERDDFVVR